MHTRVDRTKGVYTCCRAQVLREGFHQP
jgi:hypothetical protein